MYEVFFYVEPHLQCGQYTVWVYVRVAGIFKEREEVNGVTEKPTPMDTQKTSFLSLKKLEGKPMVLLHCRMFGLGLP